MGKGLVVGCPDKPFFSIYSPIRPFDGMFRPEKTICLMRQIRSNLSSLHGYIIRTFNLKSDILKIITQEKLRK